MADDGSVVMRAIPTTVVRLTGPLLVGHLLNWGLFGALSVQCYIYYLAFPKDRRSIKHLVAFMFVIELVQTVMCTRDAFREFGSGWGDLDELDDVGWLWFSIPFIEAVVSCTSQLFYAWRIWVIGGSYYIPGVITLLAFMQGVTGIYTCAFADVLHHLSEFQTKSFRSTSVWLGGTALCDIIITASMLFYLRRAKTGYKATTTLLTRIINITVQTGLVCATFAILDLTFFIATPEQNYYFAPNLILSKLYSNSLLVIFNARLKIVGGRNSGQDDAFLTAVSAESFRARTMQRMSNSTMPHAQVGGIQVEITQRREMDMETPGVDRIELKTAQVLTRSSSEMDGAQGGDDKLSELAKFPS
ncbi:hypothetical protein EIP91_010048 [Steccherinum ochraceum]|uniref:DUF6534 domain-containing protein n=1 Tax=Steccherinum ochraceum TaxID=92696 RepID=A0A4R0RDA9_9APHY|nr:hypothetical protein EIP91_010048 [Steccherinum ochraceum]